MPTSRPTFSARSAPPRRPDNAGAGAGHVGLPWAFLVDVCRLTEGRAALVVAMVIYRRTHVCRSQTVTLPAAELAEVGVTRQRKQEALARLEAAGLVRIEKATGRTAKVTLLWKPA